MRRHLRLVALGAAVVVAAIAVALVLLNGHTTATATAASAGTTTVQRGTVTQTVSAAGTVQAATSRGLSFVTSGTVTEVNVKAGDTVTAGQVLARIDSSDAQSAVDSAQSAVDAAQTALTNAQATASPTATACATDAPAAMPSGGQQGGGKGQCGTAGNSGTGANRAVGGTDSLLSAQQQLNNAKLALSQARQRLAGTVVTAPIAARVLTVNGSVGASETPGSTPFITVSAASDSAIAASFTETDVASLAVGQTATITLPDRGTQTYTGKVSQVSPVGTSTNQLVRYAVLVAFDQAPADLLYGQSATVAVTTHAATGVLYLPSTAISHVDNGSGTITIRSGGHDEQRTVQIGLRGDRYTEIRSGVQEGQAVVIGTS